MKTSAQYRAVLCVRLLRAVLCVATFFTVPNHAHAQGKQQLVRAGQDWARIAHRAEPGQEIILMPGRHMGATLTDIAGTPTQPIVIRGVDPRNPVEIDCDLYGLRIRNCRHIRFENLSIRGARIAGVQIEGESAAPGEPSTSRDIILRNVHINETGPTGQRHAIHLRTADDVRIEACIISGWAGSAIEAVAVHGLVIRDCRLTGTPTCVQTNGVRLRAGTRDVRIEGTIIRDAGDHGISLGGTSRENERRPVSTGPGDVTPLLEAASIEVTDCLIDGARCSIAFVHVADAHVHRCTFHRPRQVVMSVRRDNDEANAGDPLRCRFDENIILWAPGDLEALLHLGRGASPSGVALGQNIWWGGGDLETFAALGPVPGEVIFPQRTDIDPRLDDEGRPGHPDTGSIGRPALPSAGVPADAGAGE